MDAGLHKKLFNKLVWLATEAKTDKFDFFLETVILRLRILPSSQKNVCSMFILKT